MELFPCVSRFSLLLSLNIELFVYVCVFRCGVCIVMLSFIIMHYLFYLLWGLPENIGFRKKIKNLKTKNRLCVKVNKKHTKIAIPQQRAIPTRKGLLTKESTYVDMVIEEHKYDDNGSCA